MDKAALNMGSDFVGKEAKSKKLLEGSIEIIKQYYPYIPVQYIASGFIKGSLGHFGAGRLVPATIYKWLGEISSQYNRDQATEKLRANENEVSIAMDLHKFPVGSAIVKKIDWYRKGLITINDWDRVPLKEIAEKISQGIFVSPEIFGIKSKT